MKTASTVYCLPEDKEYTRVLQKIEDVYSLQEMGQENSEQHFLDTFDWRLWQQGYVLTRKGIQYSLAGENGEELCQEQGSRKQRPFWWDFPVGALKDAIKPVVDIRALLPQFTLKRLCRRYQILNGDEKIILHLLVTNGQVVGHSANARLPQTLRVESLRGYHKPYRKICEMLHQEGLAGRSKGLSAIALAHDALGIDPAVLRSKFSISLHSEESISQAVQDISLALKAAMQRNLPGVVNDIDSEFLHDFRIALRRTRSLLSLMKKHLPRDETIYFQTEFKWLGAVTGSMRDLDVYLLKMDEYRSMLPEILQPGLGYFVEGLARQRKKELRLLQNNLTSERYSRLLEDWGEFLNRLPLRDDYPEGRKPGRKVVAKTIRSRFQKILHSGSQITVDTPDEALHQLRIQAKKFRYLLEFFRSLFSVKAVDAYLKQLKKFQNNLGDFNDLSVQQDMLCRYQANLAGKSEHAVGLAAALGGLIVHLAEEQRNVRTKFEKTFQCFADQENIDLLDAVLTLPETSPKKQRMTGK